MVDVYDIKPSRVTKKCSYDEFVKARDEFLDNPTFSACLISCDYLRHREEATYLFFSDGTDDMFDRIMIILKGEK